jgi:hypothetical protein
MKTLSSPRRMKSIPPGRPVLSKVRREGRQPEALCNYPAPLCLRSQTDKAKKL